MRWFELYAAPKGFSPLKPEIIQAELAIVTDNGSLMFFKENDPDYHNLVIAYAAENWSSFREIPNPTNESRPGTDNPNRS